MMRRLQTTSETRHLAAIRDFVERAAAEAGVALDERRRLVLAVDEAVSNVMEHGYGGRPDGPIEVEIACEPSRGEEPPPVSPPARVEVRIRDEGRRFDASRAVPEPPRIEPSGRLRARGYGLVLIHRLMDEVRYSLRSERVNELVLVRLLEGGKTI